MYYLNKIVLFVANPYLFGVLLVLAAVICVMRRRHCLASRFFIIATFWFYSWSCGFVQVLMNALFDLDRYKPVIVESLPPSDAIVDLGGGVSPGGPTFPYVELMPPSDRVAHAARLWKDGKAPVVVPTGWGIEKTDALLLEEFGVPQTAIWCENEARNTEENAIYTQRFILDRLGRTKGNEGARVLLVTSASHMRRAMMIFKTMAPLLECTPVVVDFGEVCYLDGLRWNHFLPSPLSLAKNFVVYKECLGILGYWLRGFRG